MPRDLRGRLDLEDLRDLLASRVLRARRGRRALLVGTVPRGSEVGPARRAFPAVWEDPHATCPGPSMMTTKSKSPSNF